MSTLHLLSQPQALEACLSRAEEGDVVLILGAGALVCRHPEKCATRINLQWRVMRDALEMHGITEARLPHSLQCIDYAAFVDLAAAASRCLSWF
ncbi:hypothetical protein F6R98_12285 [Candidatus Methylospira mobilis]|uniref:Sulfurtransferase complex subunit TusB n=1 Tax=Candidatus Methylospira mobilis TaxID=1808979 RepID=A0A5Q0BIA8_9GAMM|nr:DsrH/TusB family sulfur metabolism protein [Candidatus Methylospira mobilis]QFY43299.1 hypothetical protein F6R98_12285 [Candidatus Methylospira mobilis]